MLFCVLFGPSRPGGHLAAAQSLLSAVLPLDDQPPFLVDGKGLCGVGLGLGTHRHPVAGHKAPGAVLVQTVKTGAEGSRLRVVLNASGKETDAETEGSVLFARGYENGVLRAGGVLVERL